MGKKIEGLPDKIIRATILIGANKGANNISTIEVSKKCQISEMPIFKYFQTKSNLLLQAFLSIDKMVDKEFEGFIVDKSDVMGSIKTFWLKYFRFWLKHEAETKFYQSYRNSTYFSYDVAKYQQEIFKNYLLVIYQLTDVMDMTDLGTYEGNVFWDFILSNTLAFAIRVIEKKFPADDASIDSIFNLIFHALLIGRIKA